MKKKLTKINLVTKENVQQVQVNSAFESIVTNQFIELLKEFKDVFVLTYKNLKGISLQIVQHQIEPDTTIPLAHQVRYRLNLNYATILKQDIDKIFVSSFIKQVEEATWLSPIVVVLRRMES